MVRRFYCDEMLIALGRWLRAAGYDTLIQRDGAGDRAILERARAEGRVLVTRDRKLLEYRGAAGTVLLLRANALQDCAVELSRRLDVDWLFRPFTRCLLCNTPLVPAAQARWREVPPDARARAGNLYSCDDCGRVYWEGGHVGRMRRRLGAWRRYSERRHG